MWILPKQLHTSAYVLDTEALISDLDEQSQICEPSLLVRSKPSLARTWLQKWKRDSWTQHLSGRILKPSHGKSFVTAWTSSLEVIPASHSVRQANDSEQKIHDISGHLSQPELFPCDPESASSRTSKDTSALDSERSLANWKALVTRLRGEYSQRVKSAHLTNASGSLSWPTISVNESKNSLGKSQLERNSIPLGTMVQIHGQAAPASSNTHGSRQGLWLTPRANEPDSDPNFAARNADRGAHCHGTLSSQAKEQWRTPTSFDWKNTDCSTQVYLSDQVEGRTAKQQEFPTPRTCDWKSSPNADSNIKRMELGQATLAEFVHAKHKKGDLWSTPRTGATESSRPNNKGGIPLADQAKRQWGTPTARDHKSGRGNEEREYKELTPMVERQQSGKLNPRWVETLMGLPIGWTMPSCIRPVTIAPTSCDCLETELCLQQQPELF